MKNYSKIIGIPFFAALLLMSPTAHAIDVYLVYVGEDKAAQKELKAGLAEKGLDIKSYNADLLVLADYSGKQKVSTKLSSAKVVVFVGDKAKDVLGDKKFHSVISVEDASEIDKVLSKLQ